MIFPHSKVELATIERLANGPIPVVNLVADISKSLKVTPEAVYLGIRNLQKKRVVVKTRGLASLYVFWIQEMQRLLGSIEEHYAKEYSTLVITRDIANRSFHRTTVNCPDFTSLETTFHHIAQSLIRPQHRPVPYFFFGFAPWWMTLFPDDADAFVRLLVRYGYLPLMVFAKQYSVDKATVARLKSLGCQIVFVGEDVLPFGFEGHHVDGISLEASYPSAAYAAFRDAYATSSSKDTGFLRDRLQTFRSSRVKVARKKTPFKRSVLDLFAVPVSFFNHKSGR